MTNSIL